MKKYFFWVLCLLMVCSTAACSSKIKEQDAADSELETVILTAQNYLNSNEFIESVNLFETTFQTESKTPEITAD